MKKYRPKLLCSKEELQATVQNSNSIAEVLRKLDRPNSIATIKKLIDNYNINTDHMLGSCWNKGKHNYAVLTKSSKISTTRCFILISLKRGHQCEVCGRKTWMSNKIPLEVHHIDGDKLNNEESNLLLLCPNCHALTDNYRGKNNSRHTNISDEDFIEALKSNTNIRQALLYLGLTAKGANYARAHALIFKYNIEHLK